MPAHGNNGAGDEARTRDIQLGRLKLYQLSYSRIKGRITPGSTHFSTIIMLTLAAASQAM
ncbi:hypothetical protein DESC_610179 [Desulfosarcina cetonica]|nr:hypothetical protein DESC_610179 [Desulfosarcina cetonica]